MIKGTEVLIDYVIPACVGIILGLWIVHSLVKLTVLILGGG